MGDQLEAIAAAGDPIGVSLDPGAPPVGFETTAHIVDRLTRQNRFERLDETILRNPRNRAETKRA
jgi:hypothetical protein